MSIIEEFREAVGNQRIKFSKHKPPSSIEDIIKRMVSGEYTFKLNEEMHCCSSSRSLLDTTRVILHYYLDTTLETIKETVLEFLKKRAALVYCHTSFLMVFKNISLEYRRSNRIPDNGISTNYYYTSDFYTVPAKANVATRFLLS